MPIEIRELVIKVAVDSGADRKPLRAADDELKELKKEILKECTRIIRSNTRLQHER